MKKLTVLVVLLALGAAGGVYTLRKNTAEPRIATAAITRGDIVDAVGATGTLEAVTTVQVGTQVSGRIQDLYADFNSIVRRGQVIARLDPSLFEAQVEQARANLVRSQAEVERLRVSLDDARSKLIRAEGLAQRQLIPATELENAQVNVRSIEAQLRSVQAQVTQAEASLHQNEVNLRHTVIQAPIDGIVISRNVDVGQTVAASMQAPVLFILAADLTKMKVNASVDEADVGRIRPGQRVRFRVDAFPLDEFTGQVLQVRLQPAVVQNVVTYATVIDVPNPDLRLKPGMTANVTIEVARRENVLRVSNAALRFRPTPDIFAAFNQSPPAESQWAGGRGGGSPGSERPLDQAGGATSAAAAGAGGGGVPGQPTNPVAGNGRPAAGDAGQARVSQGGAPGERGAGGEMDPERRRRFMERLETMSPQERERAMQRMAERGSDGGPAAGSPARSQPVTPAAAGAGQTIDSLFGPLPETETVGRAWLFAANQLKPVRLRLGLADGSHTEILGDEIAEGAELVTSVITADEERARTSGGGRSPLVPQRGPGQRGGGPR
jgi:HlyD family secretion protein